MDVLLAVYVILGVIVASAFVTIGASQVKKPSAFSFLGAAFIAFLIWPVIAGIALGGLLDD